MTDAPARAVLVTGGTSGIGLACAAGLTRAGVRVWITGTSAETVRAALAHEGVAAGGSVADVTNPQQVETAFAEAARAFGGLDGVFANAGVDGQALPAQELDPAAFQRVLDVNVIGLLVTAQAAYHHLRRPGRLVVNASVNALRPEREFADYNASKAAAKALADTLALEWAAEGLTVTTVAAGYFPSRMTQPYLDDPALRAELLAAIPAGRFGELEEIARLVAFLLDPASAYLNGATVTIDGGRHL